MGVNLLNINASYGCFWEFKRGVSSSICRFSLCLLYGWLWVFVCCIWMVVMGVDSEFKSSIPSSMRLFSEIMFPLWLILCVFVALVSDFYTVLSSSTRILGCICLSFMTDYSWFNHVFSAVFLLIPEFISVLGWVVAWLGEGDLKDVAFSSSVFLHWGCCCNLVVIVH